SSNSASISSMTFHVTREGNSVLSQTFNHPTSTALSSYFKDHAFDLGDYTGVSGNLDLDFFLDITTDTVGTTFGESLIFGNATQSAGPQPLFGDFNGNGVVDAADYVVWRKNPGGFPADAYTTWRSHFGQTSAGGMGTNMNTAIPEPATILLL